MQRLTQYSPKLKRMAFASIKGESVLATLDLDEGTWMAIVQEIKKFTGTLEGESDLSSSFPKLCAYLLGVKPVPDQIDDMEPDQALSIFAQKIRNLASNDVPNADAKTDKGLRQANLEETLF